MANDLIVIEDGKDLTSLYTEKTLDTKLEEIKTFARSVVAGDVTTKQGSADVRTMAARVRSTKVAITAAGKELTDGMKKRHKKELETVTGQVDKIETELTALAEEIRKPLTEWEDKEKVRKGAHEKDIGFIANCLMFPAGTTSAILTERIAQIEELSKKQWEEFEDMATAVTDQKLPELIKHRDALIQTENMAAENARLKADADARKVIDDAAAAKTLQAQRDADLLLEAEHRELALIAGGFVAAIVAKEKADKAAKDLADKAVLDEKKRLKDEEDRLAADLEIRLNDEKHKKKIVSEALHDIGIYCGFAEAEAEHLLHLIAEGKISHVSIKF